MKNEKKSKIIDCIKQDNLLSFSAIFSDENDFKIAFGRFPLLSVCYLYNAKKIIKKYEKKLLSIKNYIKLSEPFFLYSHFKKISGKALRLYLSASSIVSPLEMLALLHRDSKVKSLFMHTERNEQIETNLIKIYESFHTQTVTIKTDKIYIGLKRISPEDKSFLSRYLLIGLLFATLLFSAMLASDFAFGGLIFNQIKVYSAAQFQSVLFERSHATLQNDITLSNEVFPTDFYGKLDGNGHTLYVDYNGKSLLKKNFGIIKNLKIVYQNFEAETLLSSSASLLTTENLGVLSNIKILFKNNASESKISLKIDKTNDSFFTGFALSNNGKIENCDIFLDILIAGSGNKDCYVSAIAGKNNGEIKNCKLLESSSIEADEVDIAGIVAINLDKGKIIDCTNYASLSQTSAEDNWSPTVAGIAATNYGEIINCRNEGPLVIVSTFATETSVTAVCGGLVGWNYGKIAYSKNNGNITVTTDALSIYCGGIVAFNMVVDFSFDSLKSCGVECQISATATGVSAKTYVGGIGGFFLGKLENCFSLVQFTTPFDSSKDFVGLAFGSTGYSISIYFNYLAGENNFVMQQSGETTPQVGILKILLGSAFYDDINYIEMNVSFSAAEITTSSETEIKTSEVYFE